MCLAHERNVLSSHSSSSWRENYKMPPYISPKETNFYWPLKMLVESCWLLMHFSARFCISHASAGCRKNDVSIPFVAWKDDFLQSSPSVNKSFDSTFNWMQIEMLYLDMSIWPHFDPLQGLKKAQQRNFYHHHSNINSCWQIQLQHIVTDDSSWHTSSCLNYPNCKRNIEIEEKLWNL